MRSNGLFSILFLLWMALLTVLSLVSMKNMEIRGPEIPFADKVAHMGFYLVAMLLGSLFLWERFGGKREKKPALFRMGLFLLVYGMVIEVLQWLGGNDRSAEWGDLLANLLGIGFGGWISLLIFRKVTALNWPD